MSDPVKREPASSDQVWEQGWEHHRQLQMERLARLPMSEKLIWLEEAHRLVLYMQSERIKSRTRD